MGANTMQRRNPTRRLSTCLLFLNLACGGDDSQAPETHEESAARWAEGLCDRALECECAAWDDAFCRTTAAALFQNLADDGEQILGIVTDVQCLDRALAWMKDGQACTDSVQSFGRFCTSLTGEDDSACRIFHGEKQRGEPCEALDLLGEVSTCAQGLRCDPASRTCARLCEYESIALGEPCGGEPDQLCAEDAQCDPVSKVCVAPGKVGEPCVGGFLCTSGAYCAEGVCAPSRAAGEQCMNENYAQCAEGRCENDLCLDEPRYCKALYFYDAFPGDFPHEPLK